MNRPLLLICGTLLPDTQASSDTYAYAGIVPGDRVLSSGFLLQASQGVLNIFSRVSSQVGNHILHTIKHLGVHATSKRTYCPRRT